MGNFCILLFYTICALPLFVPPVVEDGAYIITNGYQLANIRQGHSYVLGSDIDLKEYKNWAPIENFHGNIDGRGYKIKNLRIQGQKGKIWGLFGTLDGAVIQNLHIEGAIVYVEEPAGTGPPGSAGILAGRVVNSTVVDSTTEGSVFSSGIAGGFVGTASGSAFKGCRSYSNVTGENYAGGFAGILTEEAVLVHCRSYGDVYGDAVAGGFVGEAEGSKLKENANHGVKIVQCHAFGDVGISGRPGGVTGAVGGFAGTLAFAAADAVSASGSVYAGSGTGPTGGIGSTGGIRPTDGTEPSDGAGLSGAAGGFVGKLTHRSRITNACAYGDVNNASGSQTGGFIGLITHGSGIQHAFSAGDVKGGQDTGGFAGAIAVLGAPNTLFGCISFAQWVGSENGARLNRLVGRMEHNGVNNCYAYLGSMVACDGEGLRHVNPNPYGHDGGDVNNQTIEALLSRLGWDQDYWCFNWEEGGQKKPRLISLYNF